MAGQQNATPGARVRRAKGWWQNSETLTLVLSNRPRKEVAEALSVSIDYVSYLRWQLRTAVGLPMDRKSVGNRIATAKTGQKTDRRTMAAMIVAARRQMPGFAEKRTLSDAEVVQMRERRAAGDRIDTLAAEAGLATTTVSALVTGARRRNAGGPISSAASNHKGARITRADMDDIRAMRGWGMSLKQIAVIVGISAPTISKALNGKVARARQDLA